MQLMTFLVQIGGNCIYILLSHCPSSQHCNRTYVLLQCMVPALVTCMDKM